MLTQGIYLYNERSSNWKTSPNKWTMILAFLMDCPDARVGSEENCMRFIDAMMWTARSGAPRRTLPSERGNWNGVCKRFAGWSDRGRPATDARRLCRRPRHGIRPHRQRPTARARQAAAGAPLKGRGQSSQALGKSGGGFGAKSDLSVAKRVKSLKFILTGGETSDIEADCGIGGRVCEEVRF